MGNFRNSGQRDQPDSLFILLCPLISTVMILGRHLQCLSLVKRDPQLIGHYLSLIIYLSCKIDQLCLKKKEVSKMMQFLVNVMFHTEVKEHRQNQQSTVFLLFNEIMVIVFNFTPISSLLYLYNLANIHIKEHLYSDTLYQSVVTTECNCTHQVILPHNLRPQNVLL